MLCLRILRRRPSVPAHIPVCTTPPRLTRRGCCLLPAGAVNGNRTERPGLHPLSPLQCVFADNMRVTPLESAFTHSMGGGIPAFPVERLLVHSYFAVLNRFCTRSP